MAWRFEGPSVGAMTTYVRLYEGTRKVGTLVGDTEYDSAGSIIYDQLLDDAERIISALNSSGKTNVE